MEQSVSTKKTYKIDSPDQLAKIITENLCVVIKISACWCGPCKNKHFLEMYCRLKDNYKKFDSVKFIELDIDDDLDILEDNNYYDISVKSVPTFLIASNGNFIKKFEGGSDSILESINTILLSGN